MITTLDITPEESLRQQLDTWAFETGTVWENSSREAVVRYTPHLKPGASVIDLGCGDGAATKYFKESGFLVTGVDANPAKLEKNPTRTVCTDMVTYLKRPRTLPNVFIHHALEHLPNPQDVLDLIAQRLASKGLVYIEVPAGDHTHSVHHSTFDTPEDLLPDGFEILEKGTTVEEHYLIARKP